MEKGNIFTHIKRLAKFIASKVAGNPASEKGQRFASDREMEIAIGKLVAHKKAEQQAIIRAFQPGNFDAIQRRLLVRRVSQCQSCSSTRLMPYSATD